MGEIERHKKERIAWIVDRCYLILCRIYGHRWTGEPFRRECMRCGRISHLMERRYPAAGETKYTWSDSAD